MARQELQAPALCRALREHVTANVTSALAPENQQIRQCQVAREVMPPAPAPQATRLTTAERFEALNAAKARAKGATACFVG